VSASDVPARVIIEDDLRRSRVTVFFRLLLAVPHFVWLALWTIAALLAAIANWVATLARGRPPSSLYRFLSAYLRYSTHLTAFLLLAANPFPGFTGRPGSYPVDLEIAPLAPQHRLKTLFRIFLAVPALIFGSSRGAGAGNFRATLAFLGWFASLATGRMPQGFRNGAAWGTGYGAQVATYLFVLSDRYPNSDPGATGILGVQPAHPVRLRVDDDLRRSRVTVFFRILLFVPHYIWLVLWGTAVLVAVVLNWIATLATGRSPAAFHRFTSAYLRYQTHAFAFVTLIGNPFPGFLGRPGSYPIDLEIDGPERQHRLKTLFRFFLALPALFASGALSGVLFIAAFLGWFAALVTGRMPTGFRNVGAWSLRYSAQANAYLYLLTDRYPYSGPEAGEPEALEPLSA
jgi:Domain of unknown function (DUF4389)